MTEEAKPTVTVDDIVVLAILLIVYATYFFPWLDLDEDWQAGRQSDEPCSYSNYIRHHEGNGTCYSDGVIENVVARAQVVYGFNECVEYNVSFIEYLETGIPKSEQDRLHKKRVWWWCNITYVLEDGSQYYDSMKI